MADASGSTAMSFIVRESLSEIFDNFCIDAISIDSVLVRFKVSLLAVTKCTLCLAHNYSLVIVTSYRAGCLRESGRKESFTCIRID